MKTSIKMVLSFAFVLMLLLSFLPSCDGINAPEIKVQLSFSEPPVLNKPVQVTATFSMGEGYDRDAHNVTARIILPEGIKKIDGDLEWYGNMIVGNIYTISATVESTQTGVWKVEARAIYSPNKTESLGGTAELYVIVSENSATVSEHWLATTYPPEMTLRSDTTRLVPTPPQIR